MWIQCWAEWNLWYQSPPSLCKFLSYWSRSWTVSITSMFSLDQAWIVCLRIDRCLRSGWSILPMNFCCPRRWREKRFSVCPRQVMNSSFRSCSFPWDQGYRILCLQVWENKRCPSMISKNYKNKYDKNLEQQQTPSLNSTFKRKFITKHPVQKNSTHP